MGKKSLLPHGFKSKSEKLSLQFRKELELQPHEHLCGFKLAEHLNVKVFTALDFFDKATDITPLVGTNKTDNGWSALTMKTGKGNTIIIHNHLHAPSRQQSNLMHELAHHLCDHQHTDPLINKLPLMMRQFDSKQEEEAIYLGATLQIPRDGLIWALKNKMKNDAIADHFNSSLNMVVFRLNSTGVGKQLSYLSKK